VQLAIEIALILVSVLLTILILLHRGKGGGLSDMFGGGVSSSVGGSSVAERNLNRITLVLTVLWVGLIVGLSLLLKSA
jgi:preprotein translocase subunit SecG